MIKQIWFVRNITRLFVSLSLAINLIISLYSVLSAFALTAVVGEVAFADVVEQFGGLLFFPLVGWCLFLFFFGLGFYLKRVRKKFLKHKTLHLDEQLLDESKLALTHAEEMRLLFLSHFITSSNLSTSITFAFFSLDVVSKAKNISSFGIFPVVICWIATLYYYVTLILKLYNSKTIVQGLE